VSATPEQVGPAVYLDNAATTRLDPEVLEAMLPYLRECFGNPGSLHRMGAAAEAAVTRAREQVAAGVGASSHEIVFTSGGTESNALAVTGVVAARHRRGRHVITSAVEHPSVHEAIRSLEARYEIEVTTLPVDLERGLSPAEVAAAVRPDTILVSVMHVQNETGAVFPVEAMAQAAKAKSSKLVFHSDGVQAVGKIPPPGPAVDLYSLSGHKAHGPKGGGALRVRRGLHLVPLVRGGGQEGGLRGGTHAVPTLVGMGRAVAMACAGRAAFRRDSSARNAELRAGIEAMGGLINSPSDAFPSILNASFPGVLAEPLLHALEAREVFVSTAAACHTSKGKHSAVLEALGIEGERLESALRFALSRETSPEDIARALMALESALTELRTGSVG
jgi:cysteine desulfurase